MSKLESDEIKLAAIEASHPSREGILHELYLSGFPLRQYQIGQRIQKDAATVRSHLVRLEKTGLVRRSEYGGIPAYGLTELGKKITLGTIRISLSEANELEHYAIEFALIMGVDESSDKYRQIKEALTKFYIRAKESHATRARDTRMN